MAILRPMQTFVSKSYRAIIITRGLYYDGESVWYRNGKTSRSLLGQGPAGSLPIQVSRPYLNSGLLHFPHHSKLAGALCVLVIYEEYLDFSHSDCLELRLTVEFCFCFLHLLSLFKYF